MILSRTYDGPMPKLLLGGLVALLAAGLLWPLAELALLVVAEGAGAAAFLTPYNLRAVGNTIVMGAVVALTATVLGFVVAYAITVTRACGRGALKVLFLAPLFAPSIMPAIGIIYLVGSNGLLFNLDLYGPLGVFLAGLVFALPHTVMQLRLNLATMDVKLLAAARSLGAGPWRRFATVTLVHARAGLANAFMIAFILTITDFGVPKMLAGDFPMLATEIYALAVGEQNFAAAGLLSLGLLIPALLALQVTRRFSQTQTKAVFHVREPEPSPMRDAVAGVLAWCVVGAEVLVIGVVIYGSFITFWPYETQLTLGNYAFRNSAYGISPWLHSLIVSFAVAALGTVLAWMGAYLTVRMPQLPGLLRAAYDKLASLPVCIPGTVLGLGDDFFRYAAFYGDARQSFSGDRQYGDSSLERTSHYGKGRPECYERQVRNSWSNVGCRSARDDYTGDCAFESCRTLRYFLLPFCFGCDDNLCGGVSVHPFEHCGGRGSHRHDRQRLYQ